MHPSLHIQFPRQDVFNESSMYVENYRLYYGYFGAVPNSLVVRHVQDEKFISWLMASKEFVPVNIHSRQRYDEEKKRYEYDDYIFVLKEHILVHVEDGNAHILYASAQETMAKELATKAVTFIKKPPVKKSIFLVKTGKIGMETTAVKLPKLQIDLAAQYNDDLVALHPALLVNMKQKGKSGLYLFYGNPGTGKSTYIRFLVRKLSKKILFVTPALARSLDSPAMAELMISNANAIFVIEDAEDLLVSRDDQRSSAISMLLNLTDGLLGDSLGIQVIATFNTDIVNIDPALMRKGRLLGMYQFGALSAAKTAALLHNRGADASTPIAPMTLADIFHEAAPRYTLEKKRRQPIGFITHKIAAHG